MTTLWCEHAFVDGEIRRDVAIDVDVDAGVVTGVKVGAECGDENLRGLVLPGLCNEHSHAFHRRLRGFSQLDRGTFWTWREQMYREAGLLNPENYYSLAVDVYSEMLDVGITKVSEFHYVHHQPDGRPYADPNAMGRALLAAADHVGIGIELLDVLYLHGGLSSTGYLPLRREQQRFGDGSFVNWRARVEELLADEAERVGVAVHSIRAVEPSAIAAVAEFASDRGLSMHAHISEQPDENAACLEAHGATPVELFARAGALGQHFTAVHATHLTDGDIALLGDSGSMVCFCPTTERDLGDGIGPASELVAAGASLTLGTDSHAEIDLLGEARAIEHNARLRHLERGIFHADELVLMATARRQIRVGEPADLIVIDHNSRRTRGTPADGASAIFAATGADVTATYVKGERRCPQR